ncbi:MAG: thiamine pyrophosphate-binding protein, partial [Brasilonema sp.]
MSQNYTQTNSQVGTQPYDVYQPSGCTQSEPIDCVHSAKDQINGDSNSHSKSRPVVQEGLPDKALRSAQSPTVADAIAKMMEHLGVCCAFGVNGGAMAGLWGALSNSLLQVMNCRHEAGAAFAASEAYFASGRPTVV